MPNGCGYTVFSSSTTVQFFAQLSTALRDVTHKAEYKSSAFPLLFTHISRWLNHSFFAQITAVTVQLIHTIHTTYKNYKKFFLKNIITYIPKGSA
jgi:hypothetical protein